MRRRCPRAAMGGSADRGKQTRAAIRAAKRCGGKQTRADTSRRQGGKSTRADGRPRGVTRPIPRTRDSFFRERVFTRGRGGDTQSGGKSTIRAIRTGRQNSGPRRPRPCLYLPQGRHRPPLLRNAPRRDLSRDLALRWPPAATHATTRWRRPLIAASKNRGSEKFWHHASEF